MSSSAHITDDPGTAGIPQAEWEQFCAEHGFTASTSGDTWYAGTGASQVQVIRYNRRHVSFSTYRMGEGMPEVVRLAVACWVQFDGRLSMDPELRNILADLMTQAAA